MPFLAEVYLVAESSFSHIDLLIFPQVCSGDRVKFSWHGQTMNMWMFSSKSDFDSCSKGDLNFLKNPASSGSFQTKANNSGWRYYAAIAGTDKGDEHHGAKGQYVSPG